MLSSSKTRSCLCKKYSNHSLEIWVPTLCSWFESVFPLLDPLLLAFRWFCFFMGLGTDQGVWIPLWHMSQFDQIPHKHKIGVFWGKFGKPRSGLKISRSMKFLWSFGFDLLRISSWHVLHRPAKFHLNRDWIGWIWAFGGKFSWVWAAEGGQAGHPSRPGWLSRLGRPVYYSARPGLGLQGVAMSAKPTPPTHTHQ